MLDEHLLRLNFRKFKVLFALVAVLFICEDHESLQSHRGKNVHRMYQSCCHSVYS